MGNFASKVVHKAKRVKNNEPSTADPPIPNRVVIINRRNAGLNSETLLDAMKKKKRHEARRRKIRKERRQQKREEDEYDEARREDSEDFIERTCWEPV